MDIILKGLRHPAFAPIAVFVLGIIPWCSHLLLFYTDERFYFDASILMVQSGDHVLPRYGDGSLRLNKPLGTYWVMAASFHLLGIHVFAARAPFLLAGVGVLAATFSLAKLITRNAESARMAVWILIANPLFWLSSMRCLPDILLTFFLTLAVLGYCMLRFGQKPGATGVWLITVGFGAAVAVKGAPALLLGGCLGLHLLLAPPRSLSTLRAWHSVAALLGLAIGALGFLPIFFGHREAMISALIGDQVTGRICGELWKIPVRMAMVGGVFLAGALPWIIPILVRRRQAKTPASNGEAITSGAAPLRSGGFPWTNIGLLSRSYIQDGKGFAVTLLVVWILATSTSWNASIRYLVPMLPLLAALLANALCRVHACDLDTYGRFYHRSSQIFVVLLSVVVVAILVQSEPGAGWRSGGYVVLGFAVAAAAGLSVRVGGLRFMRRAVATCAGLSGLVFGLASAVYLPDLGGQVADAVERSRTPVTQVLVKGNLSQVSRVRLALPTCAVCSASEADWKAPHAPLIHPLPANVGSVPAARCFERVDWAKAPTALLSGRFGNFLHESKTSYHLLLPEGR